MQPNPYAPPSAPIGATTGAAIDPERAAEIQAKIKRLNSISLGLGVPGLVLQAVGNMSIGGQTGTIVTGVGLILLIIGLSFYAKMKGRSGWWGVLGLLSILGLIALAVLPSNCHGCGQRVKGKRCPSCGAPSGAS
jgi:hypothetical protein